MFTCAYRAGGDGGAGAGGAGAGGAAEGVRVVNGTRGVVVGFGPWPVVRLKTGAVLMAEPVARVQCIDGIEDLVPLMGKSVSKAQRPKDKVLQEGPMAVCVQVPLMLAQALTIHKAQGMTLSGPTVITLKDLFAYGQGYVALSRLTEWKHVFIDNIAPETIRCHPAVAAYYLAHGGGIGEEAGASAGGSADGSAGASAGASAGGSAGASAGGSAGASSGAGEGGGPSASAGGSADASSGAGEGAGPSASAADASATVDCGDEGSSGALPSLFS